MTPAEKLNRSRLAIIEYLEGRERKSGRGGTRDEDTADDADAAGGTEEQRRARRPSRGGWIGGMSGAARAWWRHHPAQLALEMATPTLQSTLRKRPFLVLGVSAGVGALLVVTAALQSLFARLRIDQTVGLWWRIGILLALGQLLVLAFVPRG